MPCRRSCRCLLLLTVAGLLAGLAGVGCTVPYHQREKVARRAMQFDIDEPTTYIRNKAEAAREGSLGGFGGASAGGCGCQ